MYVEIYRTEFSRKKKKQTFIYGTWLSQDLSSSLEMIAREGWSTGSCFNCNGHLYKTVAFEFIRTKAASQLSSFTAWLFLCHHPLVVFCSGGIIYLELLEDPLLSGFLDSQAVVVSTEAASSCHLTIQPLEVQRKVL